MALEVPWYDIACFGMVGVAIVGALWVLGMNEGASQRDFETTYESLLLAQPDNEVIVNVLPRGHVGTIESAYGCWQFFNKPTVANGACAEFLKSDVEETLSTNLMAYREKGTKGSIKLQSRYAEEQFQQRAGFWGLKVLATAFD
ncbi:hypothetical protein SESBI_20251 [Sesbania bispinosa]|nr:hypothetical protein SESBI_20251 [Sesbania bispinosa]